MTGLRDLKVGDRVQVFERGSRVFDGTVVKVGRTLLHVSYGWRSRPVTFRLDNGADNDGSGWTWVKTPEQAAEDERRRALVVKLREAGVELRHGRKLSTDTLVALVAVLDRQEGGDE